MSFDEIVRLTLAVDAGPEADQEELDRLTRQLMSEIRELDLEWAELAHEGNSPEGTKSCRGTHNWRYGDRRFADW